MDAGQVCLEPVVGRSVQELDLKTLDGMFFVLTLRSKTSRLHSIAVRF
jgi:hypothetical protein